MHHVPALVRRELGAFFLSPIAYMLLFAYQVIAWYNFALFVDKLGGPAVQYTGLPDPLNYYISGSPLFWFSVMFAAAVLTMRLVSEEKRTGTIEGLLTVPVTETEIVLAKWLAAIVMFWTLLLPFALYLPFLRHYGQYAFDLGPAWALAIGVTTTGMMFLAIGLFFSSLTRNQIIAAVFTFFFLFLFVLIPTFSYEPALQAHVSWAEAIRFVAITYQTHTFGMGQLDLRYLAFHLCVTGLLLFLTCKVLEHRRGR
jgi:ABC-2 type transport system permease protein